ncbi:hypothetical protein CsSME_00041872 [Camellia sinensis var. sinensis]
MKVHPAPKKRNITIRYNIASTFSQANALACRQKKLRRLPHIFAKVLELPFHSDADVLIDETSDCFRFVVNTDDIGDDIRAQTIEIYPGVTKIVIRGTNVLDLSMDELELDMWRFRLPASTRPELASAAYNDGQLVVMVPKDANFNGLDVVDREEEVWGEGNGDIGAGRLVLVQFHVFYRLVRCFNWVLFLSLLMVVVTVPHGHHVGASTYHYWLILERQGRVLVNQDADKGNDCETKRKQDFRKKLPGTKPHRMHPH